MTPYIVFLSAVLLSVLLGKINMDSKYVDKAIFWGVPVFGIVFLIILTIAIYFNIK